MTTKQRQQGFSSLRLVRSVRWCLNVASSILHELRYFLMEQIRFRASVDNYASYRAQRLYPDYLKVGAAIEAVRPLAEKYCKGRGVDVGAGRWPLAIAREVENCADENAYRIREPDESLDFVFSSHTLEHLEHPWDAIHEWIRVLKPGGVLFLYLPHPACEMWRPERLRFHKWSPDPVSLEKKLISEFGLQILYVSYLPDAYFSFVVIARKAEEGPSPDQVHK